MSFTTLRRFTCAMSCNSSSNLVYGGGSMCELPRHVALLSIYAGSGFTTRSSSLLAILIDRTNDRGEWSLPLSAADTAAVDLVLNGC
eukprot:m.843791 g.843791  ORF g.843791 m.843791 type:complete len:87 (+) comp23474_c1_seq6:3444-3704(+)